MLRVEAILEDAEKLPGNLKYSGALVVGVNKVWVLAFFTSISFASKMTVFCGFILLLMHNPVTNHKIRIRFFILIKMYSNIVTLNAH